MDMNNLPVGTPVVITGAGLWGDGYHCTIARSYTIRHGHRMYDLEWYGREMNYYAPSQLVLA